MARIGINSRLATTGGRWQVRLSPIVLPPNSTAAGGGLGFWWVHEVGAKDGPLAPPYRFRVQRDAVMWAGNDERQSAMKRPRKAAAMSSRCRHQLTN